MQTESHWKLDVDEGGATLQHARHALLLRLTAVGLAYRADRQDRMWSLPLDASADAQGEGCAWQIGGPHCALTLGLQLGEHAQVTGTLKNVSTGEVALDRLSVSVPQAWLDCEPARYTFFKHGYQSWTETRVFSARERQTRVRLPPMNVLQDNPRNLASGRPGEFTSDLFAVLGNPPQSLYLLVGQAGGFRQFVYVRARLDPGAESQGAALEWVYDFGGQTLPPGGELALDEVVLTADAHANRVQDAYWDLVQVESARAHELPTGWCSWYYYYSKVSAQDLTENLAALQAHPVDWRWFVLDDGYQTAVGDWLSINDKFPQGLRAVAEGIRGAGLTPGLWLAPFIARGNSRLYREHPEWVLRDGRGKPILAGWNPGWGLEGRFYGLDTTHAGFQEYLRQVISTVVHSWGFPYLKLDFTYAACLPGLAHDRTLSAAERLALGYRLVREAAGPGTFILGCGSPFGPARGLVDAMRIGPDVAPYWFDTLRTVVTGDRHAVCTQFAIRSTLNRSQMHRRWWVNDPDCLLLRDTDTRLTRDERYSLANAVIVTGGMYVLSDRLSRLSDETWQWMGEIERLVCDCDRGRAWPLDYMEREMPEAVYNSQGYLAVFNFQGRPARKQLDLRRYLAGVLPADARFTDVWSGEAFAAVDGVLDLGELRAHASRLLRVMGRG